MLLYFKQVSDTGLKVELLQRYIFIPLDIFKTSQENIDKSIKDMEFCQIQLNYLDYDFQDAKGKLELLKKYNLPASDVAPAKRSVRSRSKSQKSWLTLRSGLADQIGMFLAIYCYETCLLSFGRRT